jgi:hypothetical protein
MRYIVAYQKGGNCLLKVVGYINGFFCLSVAIFRAALHADFVHCGKRTLAAAEVTAAKNEYNKKKY